MFIQAEHLAKSYGGEEVLRDIAFTISNHEKVGLVGQNGSGKSTLFKLLIGEEVPDSGSVTLNPKLAKLGYLPQAIADPNLVSLSSGQKIERFLTKVLSTNPAMLLLDEPTNHLDWEALDWLEKVVQNFSGPILVVSHDRRFLDNTVSKILELEKGRVKIYGGNYTFYRQQKQIDQEAHKRMYQEQQRKITRLEERARILKNRTQQLEVRTTGADHYVRRKAAKAARAALSIEKRVAKELIESKIEKPEPIWELRAIFSPKLESSQTVVQFRSVSKSFNDKKVIADTSFVIQRNQRVALLGNNGSGKTTIIKLILGELQPDSGEVNRGNNVQIGYLSQEHQELSGEGLVIDELINDKVDKTQAYKLLRRFLLPPEKINQPVRLLSSGEKAKLLLAKIMASGTNFIILDEPTNHLDIPSREALEESLASYPGTLLVVSHDRYFLERVGITDWYLINQGKLNKLY